MKENSKVTFTHGGNDIIVTHRTWQERTIPKTDRKEYMWVRDRDSRYYSLKSMEWATVDNLLREWHCTSGESVDELFELFKSIDSNLKLIAEQLNGQVSENNSVTVTFGGK